MSVCLSAVWRAGRLRRWHSNADLSRTEDYLDGHSARVAKLMLALAPDVSRELLIAALVHDDGEPAVGDMSYLIKNKDPKFAAQLAALEHNALGELWGFTIELDGDEALLLELCDRLDSWLWVKHHQPEVLKGDGWPGVRECMEARANALGLLEPVLEAL